MRPTPTPTPTPRTDTLIHTFMLTSAAALTSQLPHAAPRAPYLGKHRAPRVQQPPAQGRAAGGGGGRSPGESGQAATNPGGEGGAPTSERGLPGGGHLRTSPPTHAAVWAPSPTSPAPPSFRQLRLASPALPPALVAMPGVGVLGEGEYQGELSQALGEGERKGSVEMLLEPGGSSAADAPSLLPTHPQP